LKGPSGCTHYFSQEIKNFNQEIKIIMYCISLFMGQKSMQRQSLQAKAYVMPLYGLLVTVAVLMTGASEALAYSTYSTDGSTGNCATCHGDFLAAPYAGPPGGTGWTGELHNTHQDMVSRECKTCHNSAGRPGVFLESSTGAPGLAAISCVGCHGREEDMGNDSVSLGRGAGLRQHHQNAGQTVCSGCHDDADPANYTPVGEDVLPNYYANPATTDHPDMPTDSCNPAGTENFAGTAIGLDNDGDGVYDTADTTCDPTAVDDVYGVPFVDSVLEEAPGVLKNDSPNPEDVTVTAELTSFPPPWNA
jgi:hypothetical protein